MTVTAVYTSTARYGVGGIDLYATRLDALHAVADYLLIGKEDCTCEVCTAMRNYPDMTEADLDELMSVWDESDHAGDDDWCIQDLAVPDGAK